jgi:hypothetical protein
MTLCLWQNVVGPVNASEYASSLRHQEMPKRINTAKIEARPTGDRSSRQRSATRRCSSKTVAFFDKLVEFGIYNPVRKVLFTKAWISAGTGANAGRPAINGPFVMTPLGHGAHVRLVKRIPHYWNERDPAHVHRYTLVHQ